ncbi:MAG: acyl-CoA dehydrogenase [Chloroflexi bacterium]|nr:MAG: acyl-CoA dehydrogenase [Chloroflexota bacterium]
MRFDLSDEERAIREAVQGLCRAVYEQRASKMAGADGADEFWPKLSASGWAQLCLPRLAGGHEAGLLELCLVIEELGYSLAPARYMGNAAAALVLGGLDDPHQRGRAAALGDGERWAGFGQLLADGAGLAVDTAGADFVVLIGDGGAVVVDPTPPGATGTPGLDLTRRFTRVSGFRGERVTGRLQEASDCIEVLIAAELVGVAQHAMELAVEHAKQREQFGRPIGAYQAVSHRCADMLVAVESARSAVLSAAWTADHMLEELPFAASVAKVSAAQAGWQVTAAALQVHGGMGFTWEHPIHLFLRRAAASSRMLGSVDAHLDRIAALNGVAAASSGDALPAHELVAPGGRLAAGRVTPLGQQAAGQPG